MKLFYYFKIMTYKNFRQEFIFQNTGKTIIIVGGLHGNEQSSVYAIDMLVNEIERKQFIPTDINKIIIYNYVNYDGILSRDRLYNGIDLNRAFTNKKSNINIIEMIKYDIKSCDVVIDVHSSFHTTEFLYIDQNEYAKSFINLCQNLGITYVIPALSNDNTLKSYVNTNFSNKIGFTLEINQNDNNIDQVSALKCVSILKNLILSIPNFKKISSNIALNLKPMKIITADVNGLVKFNDNLRGKFVKRGDNLGYILNMDKTKMLNIIAPCDGIIIVSVINLSYLAMGDIIYSIQPIMS